MDESESSPITLKKNTEGASAVGFDLLAYFAPGLVLMFLMDTVSYGGCSILAERRTGQPYLFVGCLGILVMKLNWGCEPLALFVLLFAVAFGTTMGTFIKTEGQASGLSIMFGMIFALMGGCWYPLELFRPAIQNAERVLPTTWATQGMLDLGTCGRGLVDIPPEAGVLLGFAVQFFSAGVWQFRLGCVAKQIAKSGRQL